MNPDGPGRRDLAAPIKTRTLLVPAVRDPVLQTAAARQLSKSFEEEFLECSFAYRPGRGVDRAIARIRELQSQGFQYVYHPFEERGRFGKALGRVKELTAALHLTLNEENTHVTSFAEGFRFLGAYFHRTDV